MRDGVSWTSTAKKVEVFQQFFHAEILLKKSFNFDVLQGDKPNEF